MATSSTAPYNWPNANRSDAPSVTTVGSSCSRSSCTQPFAEPPVWSQLRQRNQKSSLLGEKRALFVDVLLLLLLVEAGRAGADDAKGAPYSPPAHNGSSSSALLQRPSPIKPAGSSGRG